MVPSDFTDEEIEMVRKFILNHIKTNSRWVHGKRLGNPFIFYKTIGNLLGYYIESSHDGDRLGIVVGEASRAEFPQKQLLISAVVVSEEYRRPGAGFYVFADEMGIYSTGGVKPNPDGAAELTWWDDHVNKIVQAYGKS